MVNKPFVYHNSERYGERTSVPGVPFLVGNVKAGFTTALFCETQTPSPKQPLSYAQPAQDAETTSHYRRQIVGIQLKSELFEFF